LSRSDGTSYAPWQQIIVPRADLRDGKPLDASEFAVHLDQVRLGKAPPDYVDPERFFERTVLTNTLTDFAAEVIRRLSGVTTETSAVFNMTTQFGGGKTHALTALFHLANGGPAVGGWLGVNGILKRAELDEVPKAATAVFVGTEFDSIAGRGEEGEPRRHTPWGEIAWQLGGLPAYDVVRQHDESFTEPKGDVIRSMLSKLDPPDSPWIILMDEVLNYMSTYRELGYHNRLYNFTQSLSEVARSEPRGVLVASVPASDLEYTDSDAADQERLKKMLDRVGKAIVVSADVEAAEIVRRRLFEWDGLPDEARVTIDAYVEWISTHRNQLGDVEPSIIRQQFEATYPFHPSAISVFERKWQSLPRFQRTRGILRLLALWVSSAYADAYKTNAKDPLLLLGDAPLDDPYFRAAALEQLGSQELAAAITTDIAGAGDSHAVALDAAAHGAIAEQRLNSRVATTVFFESNGGQTSNDASLAEIRLDVGGPGVEVVDVETVLETLKRRCYYLTQQGGQYRFSVRPNLNQIFIHRRADVSEPDVRTRVRKAIMDVLRTGGAAVDRVWFETDSAKIPDQIGLRFVVMPPDWDRGDQSDVEAIGELISNHGSSARKFRTALIFIMAESSSAVLERARDVEAWTSIRDDVVAMERIEDSQRPFVQTNIANAEAELSEAVWSAYNRVYLLAEDQSTRKIDIGVAHSTGKPLADVILAKLEQEDEVVPAVGPQRLLRGWPPQQEAWATRDVRDLFYSSPKMPRLADPSLVKTCIASGVRDGVFAYAEKASGGKYDPIRLGEELSPDEIEISDDAVLLRPDEARRYIEPPSLERIDVTPAVAHVEPGSPYQFSATAFDQHGHHMPIETEIGWTSTGGEISTTGLFKSDTEGSHDVTAAVGDVTGTARALVRTSTGTTDKEQSDLGPATDKKDEVSTEKRVGTKRWDVALERKQWFAFSRNVLTRAGGSELFVHVSFELPEDAGSGASDAVTEAIDAMGLDAEDEG
jgi:Protein of unknown function (DUF499)